MHPDLEPIVEGFRTGRPIELVAFGDSITAGSQIGRTPDPSIVYHKQWHEMLASRYPALNLRIENRGVPGDRIHDAHERVDVDVINASPDIVIVAFGINDTWLGPDMIDQFESEYIRLIDRIRASLTSTVIVLMTTNMYAFEVAPDALDLAWFARDTARYQNDGWTDLYMNRVRQIAQSKGLPLADGYKEWEDARKAGIDTDTLLANKANHPNKAGHRLLADSLMRLFDGHQDDIS